ncbi:MAG: hypothetical protein ACP5NX_04555 [Candidatus Bilamarchaeaceae archaeon]
MNMNNQRIFGGFLLGFFVAAFLFFLMAQTYIAPVQKEVEAVSPYVDEAYAITHSERYAKFRGFLEGIGLAADNLSAIPLIGSIANGTEISQNTHELIGVMDNARDMSTQIKSFKNSIMLIANTAFMGMVASILLVLASFGYLYFKVLKN